MRYEDENIWLTQKMIATLYGVGLLTINEHIKKIYADSELEESATIRNFRIVQTEGSRQVTRDIKHYNLQMIIAVGFKVNNECERCEELSFGEGNAVTGAYCIRLSGFGRGSCGTSYSDDNGGLGKASGLISDG